LTSARDSAAWAVEHLRGIATPWSLSHAERKHSAETLLAAALMQRAEGRRLTCYIDSFDHSAPDTADMTNQSADLVMIEPPYERANSKAHILKYFRFIAACKDIGIIRLNTSHSGRIMSPELLSALADIAAVFTLKNGINDWTATLSHWRAVHDRIVFSRPREDELLPA
jgi:dihydrodipicolinate synthase/N-acetylneuraminate lyase